MADETKTIPKILKKTGKWVASMIGVGLLGDLIKHRFLGAINDFIDVHAQGTLHSIFSYLANRPLSITVIVITALVVALIINAIVVSRASKENAVPTPPVVTIPQKGRNAGELPSIRPKIYPAAFGKSPMTFGGITIFNEGETAFLVSIPEVRFGHSRLTFQGTPSNLSKSDGKKFCEAWIERSPGNLIGGAELLGEMRSQNIDSINIAINYKDGDNRWYETICEIECNVASTEGLDIKFIRQGLIAEPLPVVTGQTASTTPIPADAPAVMLEYHWQDENASGKTDSISKPVLFKNVGDQPAINVQLEIRHNNWIARFGPIPHLFKNEPKELQADLQYGTFNMSEDRSHFRDISHQFITVLQSTDNDRLEKSACVPATVTYSNKNGEEFVSEYEFKWNHKKREAQAFLVRHGRPTAKARA